MSTTTAVLVTGVSTGVARLVTQLAAAISQLMVFAAALAVGWTWFLLVAVIFGGRLRRVGQPFEDVATIAHGLDGDARVAVVSRVTSSQHDGGRHGM